MNLRSFHEDLEKSSDKWDNYFEVYEQYIPDVLHRTKLEKAVLVEVGVQSGGSLEMWAKYCLHHHIDAEIHGIDIDPACALNEYEHENVRVHIGDQEDNHFWDKFLSEVAPSIDAFIDDGGHYMGQQINTIERVWPHITPGGVYICEDTHTSYNSYNGGGYRFSGSFIEYIKNRVDDLHRHFIVDPSFTASTLYKDLHSVHFYNSIVVLIKQQAKHTRPKRVFPRKFATDN